MSLPPTIQHLPEHLRSSKHDRSYLTKIPTKNQAAVLVLLYEDSGHLRVLLTTRAKTLRAHAGRTAFPGGKADLTDSDIIATAYREAFEEVALPIPQDDKDIRTLGIFRPYPFHGLVVTPVIAFLFHPEKILPVLQPSQTEVDQIFTHSLEAILDPPLALTTEKLVERGGDHWSYEEEYHYYKDYVLHQFGDAGYRYHHFRSSASPITGLTADILIDVSRIVYEKEPIYERRAPNQLKTYEEYVATSPVPNPPTQ